MIAQRTRHRRQARPAKPLTKLEADLQQKVSNLEVSLAETRAQRDAAEDRLRKTEVELGGAKKREAENYATAQQWRDHAKAVEKERDDARKDAAQRRAELDDVRCDRDRLLGYVDRVLEDDAMRSATESPELLKDASTGRIEVAIPDRRGPRLISTPQHNRSY